MNEPPYAAVIFDVDGTLAETERDGHRRAFNRAFAELMLPYRWSVEEYGELLAITGGHRRLMAHLVARGHDSAEADALATRLHRTKTRHFVSWVLHGPIQPRPGVRAFIEDLDEAGCRLAIATTGSRAWVEPLLLRLFPTTDFEVVITGEDVTSLKPDPQAYQCALACLGLSSQDALAVEDSPPGVAAARAAGLTCLVVPSAYTDRSALPLDDRTVLADGFDEVTVGLHRSILGR